jgi:hypothetical protein
MIGSVESRHDPHSLKLVRKINDINSRLDRIEPRESLTPSVYGSCWGNEIGWSQANAVQNTWYEVSDADMEDGQLLGVTHDGNGKLTVLSDGRYECFYAVAVEADALNQHVQTGFSINGTVADDGINHVETFGSSKQQAIPGCAILNLSANDTIEFAIRTTDAGTPTLEVDHLNLVVARVFGSSSAVPAATAMYPAEGRLTLTTGVPVTTSDVSAATTLYYTPYVGNQIELYDGSTWDNFTFTELSLALGALAASTIYDIFVYDNAGVVTLESLAWASAVARATALAYQDGVLVKSGDATRRYLGSIRINSTGGQCEDTVLERYVWNYYNRVDRFMVVTKINAHVYGVAAWRPWDNDATVRVQFVIGVQEDSPHVSLLGDIDPSADNIAGWLGFALDVTNDGGPISMLNQTDQGSQMGTSAFVPLLLGYHFYQVTQYASGNVNYAYCQATLKVRG